MEFQTYPLTEDESLPWVVEAPLSTEVADLLGWLLGNSDRLTEDLLRHGGVLFRGFPIHDDQSFRSVASLFSFLSSCFLAAYSSAWHSSRHAISSAIPPSIRRRPRPSRMI